MYCTFDDLKKALDVERLVELTDDEGFGEVNQGRIDEAIAAAQGEVDGYLGKRFEVPLLEVPPLIRATAVDLSLYHLMCRTLEVVPETRQKRYGEALRRLRDIASGVISLGIAAPPEETRAEGLTVIAASKVFSTLDKF